MSWNPVAPTPVLEGEEAERFIIEMEENLKKGVPVEEVLEGHRLFVGIVKNNPWMKGFIGNGRIF